MLGKTSSIGAEVTSHDRLFHNVKGKKHSSFSRYVIPADNDTVHYVSVTFALHAGLCHVTLIQMIVDMFFFVSWRQRLHQAGGLVTMFVWSLFMLNVLKVC